ncbi:MAG: hypothetical protein CMJ58_24380 [Planctomycetaceae bacterium]|nr:hypothetical protein [Planctomycetaceae bacterium]
MSGKNSSASSAASPRQFDSMRRSVCLIPEERPRRSRYSAQARHTYGCGISPLALMRLISASTSSVQSESIWASTSSAAEVSPEGGPARHRRSTPSSRSLPSARSACSDSARSTPASKSDSRAAALSATCSLCKRSAVAESSPSTSDATQPQSPSAAPRQQRTSALPQRSSIRASNSAIASC